MALNIPDELTLDHIWKDKKREYSFDAVFAPGITQDQVSSHARRSHARRGLRNHASAQYPS